MAAATKTKSAANRTTKTTRQEVAESVLAMIKPFGWSIDSAAVSHLQGAELDAITSWLDDTWGETPLAVWSIVSIPEAQLFGVRKNKNDAMAIVSTVLCLRGEFGPEFDDPFSRLIDSIDETGHVETRFGGMFLEATPELRIWFGRKAGKPPDLFGEEAEFVIRRLFNWAETPKEKNRKSQISNSKSETQPTLSMVPLSDIIPAADNHRKTFDKTTLQELADSIKQHGILQPLLLRLTPDAHPAYQIIAGERLASFGLRKSYEGKEMVIAMTKDVAGSNESHCSTAIKERPILFSGPMVRALLDGRKTQTRRIAKTYPQHLGCRYGEIRDRLWVRETFTELRPGHEHDITRTHRRGLIVNPVGIPKVNCVEYQADASGTDDSERCRLELGYKWKPSIHMPRWASRITLEIIRVGVERLNEISEADAYSEGVTIPPEHQFSSGGNPELRNEARTAFAKLWSTIHAADGPNGWAANPWVWVIGFKKI